jgi:DNA-binding SARP family transcriptional activator/predicted ATPase
MSDHRLHIRTLGSFIIERDHQVIETFLTRKTSLLLVYLALNPAKHSREKLATLFWSETSDEQALKNLRTVLSNIRKNTPDTIQITRQIAQIGQDVWIDARQFEEGCDAVFSEHKPSLETMMELAKLYAGEFLSDVRISQVDSLQDWIDNTRNRLHQKYQQLLYLVSTHCLETGNAYIGVEVARQLVTLNPLWEAAHRQLMLTLLHLGQSGEAQMQYERLVTLLDIELGTKPEQETVSLHERIKSGAHQDAQAALSRIVLPDIPYIPPRDDLTALRQMLEKPDHRLITLIGIGGVGKTMLATFTAHERQTLHHEDVTFISLATVKNAQSLPQIILNSLNIDVRGAASEEQMLLELRSRNMLLILDNYEQLLPETDLIERILVEAPGVRLLVTSQAALNLRQEWLLHLKGLPIHKDDAIQLFKKTVERVLPHFDLTPYEDDIREICAFLDGLPLGIVIASSQMKVLSPPQILEALRSDIRAFSAPYQDMPVRHHGFANLIDNVLRHLAAKDQKALMALALFSDSFTHDAALTVANMDITTFIGLVDKSLIQRAENFRYRIHGMLRQVLLEQLDASGEKERVRQRLTAYYVQWCHKLYSQKNQRHDDILILETEHANIWHLDLLNEFEQQRYLLEIIPALQKYWRNRGFAERVAQILLPAVDDERHPVPLRARAMVELASILVTMGQQTQAQSLCERVLVLQPPILYAQVDAMQNLARLDMQRGHHQQAWQRLLKVLELEPLRASSDDPMIDYLFVGNHTGMGLVALNLGEMEISRSHFNIALQSWIQMDEPLMQAQIRNNLALLDMREDLYDSARQHFEAIIPIFRDAGDDGLLATINGNLGRALMMVGDYAQAHEKLTEGVRLAVRLKRKASILYQLETFTQLAFLTEHYAIAAQLYGYILKHSEEDTIAFSSVTLERMAQYSAQMNTALEARFELLVNLGSRLSESAVAALAESLSTYLTGVKEDK